MLVMSIEDNQHKRRNNYKLLVDPELQKGKKKLYRLNGAIPGKPPIPDPKDPRVLKTVLGLVGSDLELPIPRFKYDRFWVGDAPQREVLVTGLPESLQHGSLLKESCETIGPVHTIRYHKHPKTRAFLGAASVLYCKAGDGLIAAEKLNESIVGGVILQVVLDDKEELLKKYLEPVTRDPRRESVDSAKAQEITTPTIKQDGGTPNFNSHDSETREEEKMSSLNQKFYPFSSLTLKNNSTSSVGESPLSSFSPGLSTPSSIDSGISLKPNFDPLLALRSSLGQSLTSKRQNAPPPLPPSAPPPPPPEEQIPPPPPTNEEGIENISSDEEQKSHSNSTSSTITKKIASKDVLVSPSVTLISPPFNVVSNANFELEYEEISGDESPVMVYNTLLEVEEISSDEGHGSDMEISDEDANPDNLIEFNVAASNKTFYPTPPIPPPPLPPVPPSFPPPLPPPPSFFPEPSYQFSKGYSDQKSSAVESVPSLPTAYYNGYPQDSSYYTVRSSAVSKTKFSPAKQWKVPTAFTREERRSQNVLFYALEQLLRILVRDVEKKLVESAAFPVLDEFWEKKDKEKQKTKSSNEGEPEEDSKKPLEPYRRMLPGLLPQTSDHQHREGNVDTDTPITPRKRLMNFKIPLTNRGSHRRNAVMIARRRLHNTEKDSDHKRRQRKRRADHLQSPRPRKRRHHVSHLSVLSDISSDELSSDEKRETDDDENIRKEIVSGPRTPSETSENESEESQLNEIFGSSSSSSNFEDEIVRIHMPRTRKPGKTKPQGTRVSKEATPPPTHPVLEESEPVVKEEDIVKVIEYRKRIPKQEEDIVSAFLKFGPDKEDVIMMKLALTRLKTEGVEFVQDVPWSHYPSAILVSPPQKRRKFQEEDFHPSGCARSEGYYKIDASDKSKYLHHLRRNKSNNLSTVAKTQVNPGSSGRGNRLNHRRVASLFTSGDVSRELQQYNQLKARKKQLRFAKSTIHNWGLFALEAIPADEMVVEYIGQVVRHVVADERERRYEAQGIGSSYLFRVDYDYVIDATKSGNHARFINHCCDPNCYAKIISVGTQKKIVIYSKRDIQSGEEITYDYKFPIEDEKIPCLCGAPQCRGTLN